MLRLFGQKKLTNEPAKSDARVYATATSKHKTEDRVVIHRFVSDFESSFDPSTQPYLISIYWDYETANGLPQTEESHEMVHMEDVLEPYLGKDGFATLVIVTTGENCRHWSYYVRNVDEFYRRLNLALADEPRFPIEIEDEHDPNWTVYQEFRASVRGYPGEDSTEH